jgi:hypothetical protein
MWAFLGPAQEFVFGFAFFPAGAIDAHNKIVRRVNGHDSLSVGALVLKLERGRLVPVFQYFRIMLQLIDPGQLNPMTFKLDDDAHFLAWIAATHILPPATHAPSRSGRTNLVDDCAGTFW